MEACSAAAAMTAVRYSDGHGKGYALEEDWDVSSLQPPAMKRSGA
jgi:hypothetical protein